METGKYRRRGSGYPSMFILLFCVFEQFKGKKWRLGGVGEIRSSTFACSFPVTR